jgi:hypothetical protein
MEYGPKTLRGKDALATGVSINEGVSQLEIHRELGDLADAIECLERTVAEMDERLKMVMLSPAPNDPPPPKAPECSTSLAKKISEGTLNVRRITVWVREMQNRLQI